MGTIVCIGISPAVSQLASAFIASLPKPPHALSSSPIRVFFPCTGLGRQRRGFEAFTAECAAALHDDPALDITVFSGASTPEIASTPLWNLARTSTAAKWLARVHGEGPYFSEQVTFFLSFVPHLVRARPHVIYFADLNLGNLCWHWRRITGAPYRLLFYNGGLTTMPFTRADLIQQLTPMGLAEATARGEDASRQVVLPHGVRIPAALPSRIAGEARARLGLPPDRQIVLSVGLLDTTIKRMDYLVREIAALPEPRPFLVLLGAESPQTGQVRALATSLLGDANVLIRTVDPGAIGDYYRAADAFILCSLREGFGLAYVEALGYGLPIVAHDFGVTRYLLDGYAWLGNLAQPGAASHMIREALSSAQSDTDRTRRHASARDRFSWEAIRPQYSAMLERAASVSVAART